jgi:2-aminoadipate transaminase
MFLWARLPKGMSAVDLLPHAVDKGVAFVPGAPFFASTPDLATLRLSFATADVEKIKEGVARLGAALRA